MNTNTDAARYVISDDRVSPTADVVTLDEFRAYIAAMNELNDWGIDMDGIRDDAEGITMLLEDRHAPIYGGDGVHDGELVGYESRRVLVAPVAALRGSDR